MDSEMQSPTDTAAESPSRPMRHWTPIRILVVVSSLAILLGVVISFWPTQDERASWKYQGQLHEAIATADRIVVRDGGSETPTIADKEDVLFEVTDPTEIGDVLQHLQFADNQRKGECACDGFPGIDWYHGKQRLALTSIQHGHSVRWGRIPGDAQMTAAAKAWVVNWLVKHGVNPNEIDMGCGGPRLGEKIRVINSGQQSSPSRD